MCATEPATTIAPPPGGLSSEVVVASLSAYGREVDGVRLAHADSHARVSSGVRPVVDREIREAALRDTLAPGATHGSGAGAREIEEEPDPYRTCFERDLDRVKYSRPFRRLAGKCQVFLAPDDAHVRTRLTHAIEVAQVSVAIASAVGLNTSLTEAIAFAHDCGHGPGGHASEDAFASYLPGGYDHAVYGADVVLREFNLCRETLDGVRHHSWRLSAPATPEGEVVSVSDRLAYEAHDFDDAVRAGIVTPEDLPMIVRERLGDRQSSMIRAMVTATITATAESGRVGIARDVAEAVDALRVFNYERIYHRPAAVIQSQRVITMLTALVEHFAADPTTIPAVASGEWPVPLPGEPLAYELAVRYVSGMTDRFAATAAAAIGLRDRDLPYVV